MQIANVKHVKCSSARKGHYQAEFGNENGLFLGNVVIDFVDDNDFCGQLTVQLCQWVGSTIDFHIALGLVKESVVDCELQVYPKLSDKLG